MRHFLSYWKNLFLFAKHSRTDLAHCREIAMKLPAQTRGMRFADFCPDSREAVRTGVGNSPLASYFEQVHEGPGLLKWDHYFEIYDRHFNRYRNKPITMMEVGVYSGGSLPMWKWYFGEMSKIIGVDIEPACEVYAKDGIEILIGDQESRKFWSQVKASHPPIDVFLDDGGHTPEQQMVTLEEMLPHMALGGTYMIEDTHGNWNGCTSFLGGLVSRLNRATGSDQHSEHYRSGFQQVIHSVHFYPFACVIEKNAVPVDRLRLLSRGTQWQPFLKRD